MTHLPIEIQRIAGGSLRWMQWRPPDFHLA
jgi:hypothetical protein